MNHARPVLGDEQLIDIELDRHTELSPQRPDTWEIDWSANTDLRKQPISSALRSAIEPGKDLNDFTRFVNMHLYGEQSTSRFLEVYYHDFQ